MEGQKNLFTLVDEYIVSEQGALPETLNEVINTYEKIGIGKRKERVVKK